MSETPALVVLPERIGVRELYLVLEHPSSGYEVALAREVLRLRRMIVTAEDRRLVTGSLMYASGLEAEAQAIQEEMAEVERRFVSGHNTSERNRSNG